MHLLFANHWLSPSLIQGLGWTLVHSIWQGLVAAIIALVVLHLTKRSRPALRYNVLVLLFSLFIIGVIVTFSVQYHSITQERQTSIVSIATVITQSSSEQSNTSSVVEQTKSYLSTFENTFNKHAAIIVTIWFLIFCIQCLRLCSGLGYIYRLRRYKTCAPPADWLKRCTELKNSLGIQKQVALLESAIVKVPLVVGVFKPLILLPAGLLANIPYSQVESILLHELAHIRRRDYLVNLFQSVVETMFFFNPAALWISSLIKEEREACCDEMAVTHLDSKSHYIQALVSFQEYAMNSSGYAMAFPGQKNYLLQRVKRIVNNENKKLSSMEKTILFCGIIAITAVSVLSTKEVKAQNETLNPVSKTLTVKSDTIPKINGQNIASPGEKKHTRTRVTTDDNGNGKTVVLETEGNGRNIKAKLKDNRITELSIDGKLMPESEFRNYEQEVWHIIENEKLQSIITNQHASEKINEILRKDYVHQQNIQKKKQLIQIGKSDEQVKEGEAQITYRNSGEDDSHLQAEEIINTLKEANIIKGKEKTTFKLTDSELLVNGVKQSAQLHKELKQKYIHKPGDFYTFSSAGGTTDITVHRD